MRTTLDIPENLLRRAKSQAALRGIRLKDFVSEAIKMALTEETSVPVRNTPTRGEETIQLDDDCVFPVIRGECGPVMRDLTPERIHEILETEDIEKALYSRGR